MISTQALELRAGARLLVKGVTVRINSGDRIGFVGRNGAGKSTLAKVLAGETMPAGGAVNRTGKIGYLPQDPRTGDEPGTVIERILSARDLDQISHRMRAVEEEMATAQGEALEKAMDRYTRVEHEFSAAGGYAATAEAEAIATSLGVSEAVFNNQLETLSGGQRRRLDVALGIIGNPELLFLDEPTTGFDPEARRSFWGLIKTLRSDGTTIVLTTHYLDEAEALADRVAVINNGVIIEVSTPAELGGRATSQATVSWREGETINSERSDNPTELVTKLSSHFGGEVPELVVTRPSLEDIYLEMIGETHE